MVSLPGYFLYKKDNSDGINGVPSYYMYLNSYGEWYIVKEKQNTYVYVRGKNKPEDSWAQKTHLEYDRYDNIFKQNKD